MTIKLEGIGPLDDLLKQIEQLTPVKAGIAESALLVKGRIATYPPVRRGPQPFKTAKQQRYFFRALRKGEIEVPYRRGGKNSEALGRRWTLAFENDGLSAVLGNNASYGPVVQSRPMQSNYHRATGWPVIEDVAEQSGAEVLAIIKQHVDATLDA